jgi:tetratricopeptide (TPR) repeat protein
LNENGSAFAGMGVDFADYDNDGWPDIFVTALFLEGYVLFRNSRDGIFEDVSEKTGVKRASFYILTLQKGSCRTREESVATILNNMGELYRLQGKYDVAEPYYKRSIGIFEKQFGDRHPTLAVASNNLGEFYRAERRYAEAESLYRHSLIIVEATLGHEHPNLAPALNNLGELYQERSNFSEAV